jgi:nucleoside-diphosphate-sugar epimerase
MRVLITGNMGYVGPVLVRHLRGLYPDAELIGYDIGFFGASLTDHGQLPETCLNAQYFGDTRRLPPDLFEGVDAVVHLAAISNDPMGNRFEAVTDAINYRASLAIAAAARDAGVKTYVFASSCSIYGAASGAPKKESDPLNPLTAYARSKIATERSLEQMDRGRMRVICLRFATACGWSPRLRLDLVLNDFVACGLSTGEITVLSDGTPWRPLIDVADMARAIDWAVNASEDAPSYLAVNVGSESRNYQVRQLAEAVAEIIPGTKVNINLNAPADTRSYKVDFSLWRQVAPHHQPQVTLDQSIAQLQHGLTAMNFSDREFRQSSLIRLQVLDGLLKSGWLNEALERVG